MYKNALIRIVIIDLRVVVVYHVIVNVGHVHEISTCIAIT